MNSKKRVFGTDGIRGRVGELIQADFVLRVGHAAGRMLRDQYGGGSVIIGKDTRRSNYMLEAALQAGLCAAGIDVRLVGPMPTPAIAYLTQALRARMGIMLSASHNPHTDNGIKFFDQNGAKLCSEGEAKIESYLDMDPLSLPSQQIGMAKRIQGAPARYIEYCKSKLSISRSLHGLKLVVDCANGASYHIAPDVLTELGAEVSVVGNQPDGVNINQDCGSMHPECVVNHVLQEGADCGIALDGDGDRAVLVDHHGYVYDGDHMLYILASYYQRAGLLQGGVVGTVMTNQALAVSLAEQGIPFERVDVGDRHVMAALRNKNWCLGGEPSGHVIDLAKTLSGDGIVTSLLVLDIVQSTGRSLAELMQDFEKFPQITTNIPVVRRIDLQQAKVQALIQEAEQAIGGQGRVLLRYSGTEPLLRVMVEGPHTDSVAQSSAELTESLTALAGEG